MNERGSELLLLANRQIDELVDLICARDEIALRQPCAGRQKLGEGTVAVVAAHTADNYQRIAEFIGGSQHTSHSKRARGHGIPKFLRRHRHDGHSHRDHGTHGAADTDRKRVLQSLSVARQTFAVLPVPTDEQLNQIPPASDMKFCDGQRTLEQIVRNLLNHQAHQVDAVRAALG
ncbi:MAG: hypothetical protein ACRDK2_11820 [Solirubrobacteraceae bacterium]